MSARMSASTSGRLSVAPRLVSALAAAALVTLPGVTAPAAHAATQGQVCFFLDVDRGPGGVGHAAWSIKDTARSDHYIWGSFEGPALRHPFAMGARIAGGKWRDLTARKSILSPAKYDFYRCQRTATGDIAKAQRKYRAVARSNYDIRVNNCLTGAGEIFRAYSPAMTTRQLPNGIGGRANGAGLSPTYYIKTYLTSHGRGWGPVKHY
ncbi:Tat pathway signal protein [Streptomyces cinerochromogenes]|uniref:Tat pathway signal protein n=1 Tax=Streptomyces cinerochromogenes TaxID=66422 RepID=UPI003682D934